MKNLGLTITATVQKRQRRAYVDCNLVFGVQAERVCLFAVCFLLARARAGL